MMIAVAELRDLTKAYGNKIAVDAVTLQIREGEILALLGPNGSGKTTILRILAFIENPTDGKVKFQGKTVNFKNTWKERLESTLVFQKTTLFSTSVYNNIVYGLKIRKVSKKTRDREVKKALETVKLEGFENRNARKLSSGEQQRVAIARALVLKTKLLLLDEPTANIDAVLETELFDMLSRLNERITIALVTHELGFVSQYVKSVACVNRRVVESLIKCSAFDFLHPIRSQAMAVLDEAMEMAQTIQKDRLSGQISMFGTFAGQQRGSEPSLPNIPEWNQRQKLSMEKEALGFYFTGHPLDGYEKEMESFAIADTSSVANKTDGIQIMLCGLNADLKEITTRKGERMAFLTMEDRQGNVEVVVFTDTYKSSRHLLDSDEPLLIVGTVQQEDKGAKVIAQHILSLLDAKEHLTQAIHIKLAVKKVSKENLEDLRAILQRHKGDCKAYVHLCTDPQCETIIRTGDKFKVKPHRRLIDEVNRYFGGEVVSAVVANGPGPIESSRFQNRNNRRFQSP